MSKEQHIKHLQDQLDTATKQLSEYVAINRSITVTANGQEALIATLKQENDDLKEENERLKQQLAKRADADKDRPPAFIDNVFRDFKLLAQGNAAMKKHEQAAKSAKPDVDEDAGEDHCPAVSPRTAKRICSGDVMPAFTADGRLYDATPK